MNARWRAFPEVADGVWVALLAFAVYRSTLLVDLGFWDTAEYQTVGPVLGIAHPTGFPLYTIVTHMVSWAPIGTVAYRLNLFSAVCAALTVAGVVAIARELGAARAAAVAAGLAFAFHYAFWDNAIRAEAHTLHAAFLVEVIWLALRWRRTREFRYMAATALMTGLALGNHHLMALTVPATFALICLVQPQLLATWRLGALIGLGALGLTSYLFIPLRALQEPALNYGRPSTWEGFRYVFFGEEFRHTMGYLTWYGPFRFLSTLPFVWQQYGEWFTPLGGLLFGALALAGLSRLSRTDAPTAWFTLLILAFPLYMATNYEDADLRRYYFACTVVAIGWAAVAATELGRRIGPRAARAWLLALVILPLGLVPYFYTGIDRSEDWLGRIYAERVMTVVKPRALVVTWWNLATPLWYVRYVEGQRPDVEIVDTQRILDYGWLNPMTAVELNLGVRPVYLMRFPSEMDDLLARFEVRTVEYLLPYSQPLYEVVGIKPLRKRLRYHGPPRLPPIEKRKPRLAV